MLSRYTERAGATASGISWRSVPPSLMKILAELSHEPLL
jgi:hypothetical protein